MGGNQVDPDHECAPVCSCYPRRQNPLRATTAESFAPEALRRASSWQGRRWQAIVEGTDLDGREAWVMEAGEYLNNLQFTDGDFFDGKDVCSVVLDGPQLCAGPKEAGLWHRTLVPGGARPHSSLSSVFSGTERVAYLAGEPKNDVSFVVAFAHALGHTGGYTLVL